MEQSAAILTPAVRPMGSSLSNSPCIVPGGGTTAFQIPLWVGSEEGSACRAGAEATSPSGLSGAATAVAVAHGPPNVAAITSGNRLRRIDRHSKRTLRRWSCIRLRAASVRDYASDRGTSMHQIESVIDLIERHLVGDQGVNRYLTVHIPIDNLRHIGTPAGTTERRAFPDAAGYQLKRSRLNLLPGPRNTDDDRHAPAAVTAFERLAHQIDVADALEAVVRAAVGQRHEVRHQIARNFLGIHEVSHAEFLGQGLAIRIQIDTDDLVGPGKTRALNHVEADATKTEHYHVGAGFDFGGVDYRADAGRDSTADVADLVERRIFADLGDRDFG